MKQSNELTTSILAQGHQITSEITQTVPELAELLESKLGQMSYSLHKRLLLMEDSITNPSGKEFGYSTGSSNRAFSIDGLRTRSSIQSMRDTDSSHSIYTSSTSTLVPSIAENIPIPDKEESDDIVAPLFDWGCTCSRREVLSIPKSSSRNARICHESSCPLFIYKRRTHQITGTLKVFNLLLRCKVAVSYSSRAFMKDLQVSPNFTVRSTVDYKSPAFSLLSKTLSSICWIELSASDMAKELQCCLRQLHGLFQDGKAWPTDVTPDGATLIYVG